MSFPDRENEAPNEPLSAAVCPYGTMTPLQRLQDQLQRDQDRRNSRLNRDAELIREYRDEDARNGFKWSGK